ncbi:hypothetical protein AMAG_08613 [Allomyces macrogynus ATCC 38327]|uniref:THIF-type NAD/FAD binding fold domain-containing protein n=1 Tax=Allomyces macrogynus (strain ATCC 38327) TaxID=578462 RepID=A0A0L0SLU3_ALLM3|nr:hypothetical protein AMAG_08613 [Allomyces macrogynus ATCC 38327]|eukprot:KNE63491.1 hypothetical protein AMAG_08613 [Allomyces macrogynus ATCC 38327]
MTDSWTPRQIAVAAAAASSLATAAALLSTQALLRRRRTTTAPECAPRASALDVDALTTSDAASYDESLVREQLARHYAFFGDDRMSKIRGAYVVVVGVGGVGSHAAHMLARAGIGKLRVIDFDQVTLSSLNRHAVATVADVGTPKVACLARRLRAVAPHVTIDPINALFAADVAESQLLGGGRPDFVIDCIDHLDTKTALLAFCHSQNIPVISSMGSGAKADPSRVHVADIAETSEDPLARAVRGKLRRVGIDRGVTVVYSTERATPGLGLIKPDADAALDEFAPLPTFRASILPVLGPLPAMFGNALAAHVLTQIAGWPSQGALPGSRTRAKDHARLLKEVNAAGEGGFVTHADVAMLVDDVWAQRSAVSGRIDKCVLVAWRVGVRADVGNLALMTTEEAARHRELAKERAGEGDAWVKEVYGQEVVQRVERGLALARKWAEGHWLE